MGCAVIKQNRQGYFYSSLDIKKVFERECEANKYDITLTLKAERNHIVRDSRTLSDLIDVWYRLHGKTLRDHIRLRKLLYRMSDDLNNPIASEFTSEQFARYRERRAMLVSIGTVNREHSYLRALFNELDRLGVISFENPLAKIRQFREREGELRYLSHDEISCLLSACKTFSNRSLSLIVKVCLATGARWSEAESIKTSQIKDRKITFINTKSNRNRAVPINEILFNELAMFDAARDPYLFLTSLSTFRKAIDKAGIYLPRGQMTHVLRHTFASHYVMSGGNIVKLRDTLGHSEITTTMRYAHLAPEHLEEALRLNPLNRHQ